MQETNSSSKSRRPAYGREIAGEFGRSLVMPFNGTWRRGRYVWWMQVLELAVWAAACVLVWGLTGSAIATGVTFFGVAVAMALVELEARVTERHLERARLADVLGVDLGEPAPAIPDGYVLAYELGYAPAVMFADPDQPYIRIGATPADRWDMVDAAWVFEVRGTPGSGLALVVDQAAFPALAQMGPLWRDLAGGRIGDLVALEEHLDRAGARDVTDRRGVRVAL